MSSMTLEEYKKEAGKTEDWAPGWDAIDACIGKLYGRQEPKHYGSIVIARALFGGDQYLDGYSVYTSGHGYLHIVTYGMSELYVNEEAFGGDYSKWGYEMTMKLPICEEDDYAWALDLLGNMARYTFTSERWFEPNQYISGRGQPIKTNADTRLTGLLVVPDTELEGADTVHGRLEFMQLVGITQSELEAITADPKKAPVLIAAMKQDNPWLVTDLARTKDYS